MSLRKTIKLCKKPIPTIFGYLTENVFRPEILQSQRSAICSEGPAERRINHFYISILMRLFAQLIQKDRGFGPDDVLASYPVSGVLC